MHILFIQGHGKIGMNKKQILVLLYFITSFIPNKTSLNIYKIRKTYKDSKKPPSDLSAYTLVSRINVCTFILFGKFSKKKIK